MLKVKHFVYASSSSVYGGNKKIAEEKDGVDKPVSLYAATKKSNELIAYNYSKLFLLPTTGLRFLLSMGHGVDLTWHYLCLNSMIKEKK